MKNNVFTLICVLMTLTAVAGDLPISREQLKTALFGTGIHKLPAPDGYKFSLSSHPDLKNNQLNGRAPQRTSISDLEGDRIVMVDSYDFDWDDEYGVATVIDSTCFMMGKKSTLILNENVLGTSPSVGNMLIDGFYSSFKCPIDIDFSTGNVTMKTGTLLHTFSVFTIDGIVSWQSLLDQEYKQKSSDKSYSYREIRCSIYAMPESWLTTLADADDYDDIYGQFYSDGSIVIDDGFAFLVQITEINGIGEEVETTWGLSPIFRHFHLFVPNGVHEYDKSVTSTSQQTIPENQLPGYPQGGGLVPRPVTPRPVNPKPISPRPFTPKLIWDNRGAEVDAASDAPLIQYTPYHHNDLVTSYTVPVYIYQANDTSILVYNLFGSNYSWNYMTLHDDSTMTFPGQAVDLEDGKKVYNYSSNGESMRFGNVGNWDADTIEWGKTYFYDGNDLLKYNCSNNKLYYMPASEIDIVPNPVFQQPVITDSTVTFSATTGVENGYVYLFLYYPEYDEYYEEANPLTVMRTDTAYIVSLVACTEVINGEDSLYSDYAFFDYEVPALGYTLGDVNGDGAVDIDDVTILIQVVLGSQPDVFCPENANCNFEGGIDIDDVTALIGRVLTGSWPSTE